MKIILNKEKIKLILRYFYELTDTNLCFFDSNFQILAAYPDNIKPFCEYVRGCRDKQQKCLISDISHCEKAQKTRKTPTYTCHAGIVETVVPVFSNSTNIGYILFGQYRDLEETLSNLEELKEKCEKYGYDYNLLSKYYSGLPVISEKRRNAIINMLELAIKYLWLEELIKLDKDSLSSRIFHFLDENFATDLSIKRICKHFIISTKSLYNIVKSATGVTVFDYITNKRVNESKKLLLLSDKSITEIALEVGYSDYNYFIKVFKKKTGETPLRFKKRNS